MSSPSNHGHGVTDYVEPQAEGGKVRPDEDPARRNRSGRPPWEAARHKRRLENSEDHCMKKVAMILTDKFEDSEATSPLNALRDAGCEVSIVSPEAGATLRGKRGEAKLTADLAIKETDPAQFDALVIPGGRSPEQLRLEEGAVKFVEHFVDAQKPIAAICHGPQLLISAGGVRGRKMTCYESVAVDLENAGADYRDEPVVTDGNLVTSRKPDDLEQFNREMIRLFTRVSATRS